jgi:predicted phosphohydrolase
MKIQYCSDLHLEFVKNALYLHKHPVKPLGDILILAGDITYWETKRFKHWFFNYVSDNFKAAYYVPGNHEFYSGKDIQVLDSPVFEAIRENIFLVNNRTVSIGKIDFFFSVLWSHINPVNTLMVENHVSDFYKIKTKGEPLRSDDFNQLHSNSLTFLKNAVAKSSAQSKVVVTHHVPSQLCNPPEYKISPINNAFVSEQYNFIYDYNIDYWIYGHHHANMPEVEINGTKLLTNQLGYVHLGEHHSFRTSAIIEI